MSNDIIRVKVETGRRKFQVGDGEPFDVDIAAAWNRWIETNAVDVGTDILQRASQFVEELGGGTAYNGSEALLFVRMLGDLVEELKKNIEPTA